MASSPDTPPTRLGRHRALLTALLALALAVVVTAINVRVCLAPYMGERMYMHERVLTNRAPLYYQYDMYLVTVATQAVHDATGLPLLSVFIGCALLGYVTALVGLRAWLNAVYDDTRAVTLGLLAGALYAWGMIPFSYHHPSDMFALGVLAWGLALMARDRPRSLWLICVVAGLFSIKQTLLAPALVVRYGLEGRWRRGLALAVVAAVTSLAVPVLYRLVLGPHRMSAEGILGAADWVSKLPRAAVVHLLLAGPPLAVLLPCRRRVPAAVWGALAAYAALLFGLEVKLNIIHEARTFWPAVPGLAAALVVWGRQRPPDAGQPPCP